MAAGTVPRARRDAVGTRRYEPPRRTPASSPRAASRLRDNPRLATPSWWGTVTSGLGWASVTIVTAFWVANAGLEQLTGLAPALTSIGRLSGLISADLLLLQVLLMARIPLLERSYGQDGLARAHRTIGFLSFDLLLLHVVLITLGYAATDGTGVVDQFADFVADYPGILLATAATVLLTLVVITSINLARRRQRYETWHLLHLYAYLGVGLSVPHELDTGSDFIASPVAAGYWWTIYLAALGAVLWWRIARPLLRTFRHSLVVERVVREGPDVVSVHVRGKNLAALNAGAGQFFLWRFLNGRGWTRAHPYSLSAAPRPDLMRITVKDLGDDSGRLANIRPGTRVLVEGPFGRLHSGVRTRPKVTLFAAGIGITPMRALLEELHFEPGDLTFIYRATNESELVLAEEVDALAAWKGARVHYLVGPRQRTRRGGSWLPQAIGAVSDVGGLRQLVPDITDQDVYLCGPDVWLDTVMRALRRAGVPPEQIHLERFSW